MSNQTVKFNLNNNTPSNKPNDKNINNTTWKYKSNENNQQNTTFNIVSPMPKPDFSKIEQKENSVNYHSKGSYKRKKEFFPESPLKKNKFYTPFKKNEHIKDKSDVSKRLIFGKTDDNLKNNHIIDYENMNMCYNKRLDFDFPVNSINEDEELYVSRLGSNVNNENELFNVIDDKESSKNDENISSFKYNSILDNIDERLIDLKSNSNHHGFNQSGRKINFNDIKINDLIEMTSTNTKSSFLFSNSNSNNNHSQYPYPYSNSTLFSNTPPHRNNVFNTQATNTSFILPFQLNNQTQSNISPFQIRKDNTEIEMTLKKTQRLPYKNKQIQPSSSSSLSKKHSNAFVYDCDLKKETQFERNFLVIKTLDEGSFGKVFLCKETVTDKVYAIKQSKKLKNHMEELQNVNDLIRFINNCDYSLIVYRNFICIYYNSWIDNDNHLYVTMEYCENGDIFDFLSWLENKNYCFNEEFYWDLVFETLLVSVLYVIYNIFLMFIT